jgi:hypothetical protein
MALAVRAVTWNPFGRPARRDLRGYSTLSARAEFRQKARFVFDRQLRGTVFAPVRRQHFAAQRPRHPLHAVANAQHRQAQAAEPAAIAHRSVGVVNRAGAAGKNQAGPARSGGYRQCWRCRAGPRRKLPVRECGGQSTACIGRRNPEPRCRRVRSRSSSPIEPRQIRRALHAAKSIRALTQHDIHELVGHHDRFHQSSCPCSTLTEIRGSFTARLSSILAGPGRVSTSILPRSAVDLNDHFDLVLARQVFAVGRPAGLRRLRRYAPAVPITLRRRAAQKASSISTKNLKSRA